MFFSLFPEKILKKNTRTCDILIGMFYGFKKQYAIQLTWKSKNSNIWLTHENIVCVYLVNTNRHTKVNMFITKWTEIPKKSNCHMISVKKKKLSYIFFHTIRIVCWQCVYLTFVSLSFFNECKKDIFWDFCYET